MSATPGPNPPAGLIALTLPAEPPKVPFWADPHTLIGMLQPVLVPALVGALAHAPWWARTVAAVVYGLLAAVLNTSSRRKTDTVPGLTGDDPGDAP